LPPIVTIGEGRALKRKSETSKTRWAGDKAAQEWLGMGREQRLWIFFRLVAEADEDKFQELDRTIEEVVRPVFEMARIRELLGEGE
jgi:hypothetical protein